MVVALDSFEPQYSSRLFMVGGIEGIEQPHGKIARGISGCPQGDGAFSAGNDHFDGIAFDRGFDRFIDPQFGVPRHSVRSIEGHPADSLAPKHSERRQPFTDCELARPTERSIGKAHAA